MDWPIVRQIARRTRPALKRTPWQEFPRSGSDNKSRALELPPSLLLCVMTACSISSVEADLDQFWQDGDVEVVGVLQASRSLYFTQYLELHGGLM